MDSESKQLSSQKLTQIQADVLAFIERYHAEEGRPPPLREIASHFGYRSVGTVQDHVKALKKKGFLYQDEGIACGLKLAHQSKALSVPVLGIVPAGRPIEAMESFERSLSFTPPSQKSFLPSSRDQQYFALRVTGDSMILAGIFEDDYVIVRQQADAAHGDIVVALIDGEATVKRLEKKRGQIRLMPENDRYQPIELKPGMENLIQGKVVSVQRFYEPFSSPHN